MIIAQAAISTTTAPISIFSIRCSLVFFVEFKRGYFIVFMFILYIDPSCPFCIFAKKLLKKHGCTYRSFNIHKHGGIEQVVHSLKSKKLLSKTSTHNTVPIVFAPCGKFIGGSDSLSRFLRRNSRVLYKS